MKRLSLIATLFTCVLATARGGDGPCPVPELSSEYFVSKKFHSEGEPARNIQLFEKDGAYLVESGEKVASIHASNCIALGANGFAAFPSDRSHQWTMYPLNSLQPRPVSLPTENTSVAIRESSRLVVAEKQSVFHGVRFELTEVTLQNEERVKVSPRCVTPTIAGLELSEGSAYPFVYFHSMHGDETRLYRMGLRNCVWEKERRFYQAGHTGLVRFPRTLGVLAVGKDTLLYQEPGFRKLYALQAKNVIPLDATHTSVLIRDEKDRLRLFFPRKGIISTVLEEAVDFHPGLVAISQHRLLISSSAQNAARPGVYEFEFVENFE